MKKVVVAASAVLAMGISTASAADLGAKMYKKAPPIVAAYDPWDIAFGASITTTTCSAACRSRTTVRR